MFCAGAGVPADSDGEDDTESFLAGEGGLFVPALELNTDPKDVRGFKTESGGRWRGEA